MEWISFQYSTLGSYIWTTVIRCLDRRWMNHPLKVSGDSLSYGPTPTNVLTYPSLRLED
jgi:hypothetical protein